MEIENRSDNKHIAWLSDGVTLTVKGSNCGVYGKVDSEEEGTFTWVIDERGEGTNYYLDLSPERRIDLAAENFLMTAEEDCLEFDENTQPSEALLKLVKSITL